MVPLKLECGSIERKFAEDEAPDLDKFYSAIAAAPS